MRDLTSAECELVSGSYYEGDIIVTGHLGQMLSFSVAGGSAGNPGHGHGRDPNGFYDNVEEDGVARPGESGPNYGENTPENQALSDVAASIIDKVYDYYKDKMDKIEERELRLATGFSDQVNGNKIAFEQAVRGTDGKILSTTFLMSDGSWYRDQDGNGKVDQHYKVTGAGTLMVDDGNGYKEVGGN